MLTQAKIVLCLNSAWFVIGCKTVKKAIQDMTAENNSRSTSTALALDIRYGVKNGEVDFDVMQDVIPTTWDDWINLPVRAYDLYLNTPRMKIRVPTVIITPNFHKIPMRLTKPTKDNIYERDRGVCQYSAKKLSKKEATLDHIIPKSRGGKNTYGNLVLADKKINLLKGNRLNHEAGLTLLKQPTSPLPIPVSLLIREAKHRDWKFFLNK